MAKGSLLQVRINQEQKEQAEKLYSSMGLTLSEAVRLFIAQSNVEQRLPFAPAGRKQAQPGTARGMLNIFASPSKQPMERDAWVSALPSKLADLEEE